MKKILLAILAFSLLIGINSCSKNEHRSLMCDICGTWTIQYYNDSLSSLIGKTYEFTTTQAIYNGVSAYNLKKDGSDSITITSNSNPNYNFGLKYVIVSDTMFASGIRFDNSSQSHKDSIIMVKTM